MLGLAQQVHRAHLGVDAFVGNDQRFSGARKQVDADTAIQLALGLGHVHVAGSHQHVDRGDRLGAYRHRHHCLHTAQH